MRGVGSLPKEESLARSIATGRAQGRRSATTLLYVFQKHRKEHPEMDAAWEYAEVCRVGSTVSNPGRVLRWR